MKILVVDDSPVQRMIMRDCLDSLGYEHLEAENGAVALDLLEHDSDVALIISDELMPEIDGYQLLTRLREANNHIPFVMVTALSDVEHHAKAIDAGASDFMAKPVERAVLQRKIAAALGRQVQAKHLRV